MTKRADLSAQQHSTVLRPGIRTYKPRRSRMSSRESAALDEGSAFVLQQSDERLDPAVVWGPGTPVVMEIGFGAGRATIEMATADPGTGLLAIDVHTPGVGDLLWRIGRTGLTNVRVMEADALAVLEFMIPSSTLAGVRTFFPDPWPKSRHHKRRLVQPDVIALIASRLAAGGYWHLATDCDDYAQWMQACFTADQQWCGGVIARPDWRPITHYEARAVREGRAITDLCYAVDGPGPP